MPRGPYAVPVLAALVFSVTLALPFGQAAATVVEAGPPFGVEITVEVDGAPEAVLARIVTVGGELDPVAMVSRHDGTWGATVELTEAEDVLVAFEAISTDGSSVISDAHRLTELGVDPAIFAPAPPVTDEEAVTDEDQGMPEGLGWLIAAVAAALLAVVLVAVWAWPRRPVDGEPSPEVLSGDTDHSGNTDNSGDDETPATTDS